MRARRRLALAATGLATIAVLAGCGSADAPGSVGVAAPTASPSAAADDRQPSPDVVVPVSVDGAAWGHVHNLAYDGDALMVGTHEGLYRQRPGDRPTLLSDTAFDVMGLAFDGRRWLASGHPADGEDLPPDLGLRASTDGRTWRTVSLLGEVDFHRLTAAGPTVLGVSAHDDALLRSTDGGSTWTRLENPGVFDIALSPDDGTTLLATTPKGPLVSTEAGSAWSPVPKAPVLAFLAWSASSVYGVTPDGSVHRSTDAGRSWQEVGSAGGSPGAFAASGDRVAVLVGGSVLESLDGGATFAPRLTGLDDH